MAQLVATRNPPKIAHYWRKQAMVDISLDSVSIQCKLKSEKICGKKLSYTFIETEIILIGAAG